LQFVDDEPAVLGAMSRCLWPPREDWNMIFATARAALDIFVISGWRHYAARSRSISASSETRASALLCSRSPNRFLGISEIAE
jgi:hypothetical protein